MTRAVEDSLDGVEKPLRQGIGAAAGRADDELIRCRGQRMRCLDVHLFLDVGPSSAGLLRIAGRGGGAALAGAGHAGPVGSATLSSPVTPSTVPASPAGKEMGRSLDHTACVPAFTAAAGSG